jgi:hypothetical protein
MTWFTEFGQVIHEAAHLGQLEHLEAAESALHSGDPTRLIEAFPGGVRIDDPRFGRVEGEAALTDLCKASQRWLRDHDGRARPIAVTNGSKRVVGEFDLELTDEGRTFVLPVAIIVEPDRAKQRVWIRTYHSQWPLLGHHVVRSPLLARDPTVAESDVVGEYQGALAAGDAERITATFEPDGCFREPAGPQFRRCGSEVLREFFSLFFSAGGGIVLEHCTVTEDGVRTVLEFNAVRWGGHDLPPQAGVAVYERGTSGKLREARIYDDVEGPVE